MTQLFYDCGGTLVKTHAEAENYKAETGKSYTAVYKVIPKQTEISEKKKALRIKI